MGEQLAPGHEATGRGYGRDVQAVEYLRFECSCELVSALCTSREQLQVLAAVHAAESRRGD